MALKIGTYFLFCMILSAIKPPIITVSPLKTETCVWTVRFVDLGLSVDISAAESRASTVASTSRVIILFSLILGVTWSFIPISFS